MEKISPKWLKVIIGIFLPIAIFTSLTMQIFADFAGDGTGSGIPIYPDNGFTQIDIDYVNGTGNTTTIDNITYPLIPMFSDGSLTSEVARGVYGNLTSQYYRYTTLITRTTSTKISQKQTFDAPLYNSATQLRVTYYAPIVHNNDFEMVLNAVTDNTANSCRITNISAKFKEVDTTLTTQDYTDGTLVIANTRFINGEYSNVPIVGAFPYTLRFGSIITDTNNLIVDLRLTFDITIVDTGVFSLATTSNYISSIPPCTQYDDIVINNITQNIEYVNIDRIPFAQAVVNSLSDIGNIQLFGVFTVGDILWAFIGIGVTVVFIKLFAGG